MLTWMRKQSGKTWVKAMYVAIAVTFFGGFGILGSSKMQSCLGVEEEKTPKDALALIDGVTPITDEEFQIMLRQRMQERMAWFNNQYPDRQIPENLLDRGRIGKEVMDGLIQRALLLKEAEKLGIKVGDQEVQRLIATIFTDPDTHVFNRDYYLNYLRNRGVSEKEYVETVRKDLMASRVADSVRSGIEALPEEVEERYAFDHQEVKLDYVALDPALVSADVLPSDTALSAYYNEHMENYYLGETRRVEYMAWRVEDLKAEATVSEEEARTYYEKSKDRYMTEPERVRASHIIIRVNPDAPETDIAAAKQMIEKIHTEAVAPDADFGELARKNSEDGTKDKGGDLGWFARREVASRFDLQSMVGPFEEAAFKLEVGQVSEPVQTQFGFHIIKLTGKKPAEYKPFESVRSEVEEEVKHGKLQALALEKAEAVKTAVDSGKSFPDAAREAGSEVKLSTWFQASDEQVFGVEDSKVIVEEAMKLKENELSAPLTGLDHVFLVRVVEVKPERQGSLEEVKDRIVAQLKPGVELEATVKKADDLLAKLKTGDTDLAAVAKEAGTELSTTDFMKRSEVILAGVGYSDTLETTVARMDLERPWPAAPVVLKDKVVLIHFLDSRAPDMSKFDEDKDNYEKQYLMKKRTEIMNDWFKTLRDDRVTFTERWKDVQPSQ
jgi:peptidyl-prolyl cis-trans isomerase D